LTAASPRLGADHNEGGVAEVVPPGGAEDGPFDHRDRAAGAHLSARAAAEAGGLKDSIPLTEADARCVGCDAQRLGRTPGQAGGYRMEGAAAANPERS